jgi:hypothetical protein
MADAKTRFVLIWLAYSEEIDARTVIPIRRQIEDLVTLPREEVEIDVWLESPGGDAHAAYKLALLLRSAACCVRVVVPDFAKSAATLLALVGSEIYMGPAAELGPLDAQMPEEGSLSGAISALNIARAADAVAADAVALAGTGGAQLLRRTGLSRAETLNAMLRFSAEFSEPLVRQLDPKLVHHAKQMLGVTATYAERLLEPNVPKRAPAIAKRLVENFPTHGCVIAYDDVEDLGLPVRPIGDYEHVDLVRELHRWTEDEDTPFIDFMTFESFLDLIGGDDEDEDADEDAEAEHDSPTQDSAGGDANERADAVANGDVSPAPNGREAVTQPN